MLILVIHAILKPEFEFLYLSQQDDGEQRKPKRSQQKGGNQSGDAMSGSAVNQDTDCAQRGGDGDEVQDDGGCLNNLRSEPDENGQDSDHRSKQNFEQYLHGRALLF